MNPFDILTTLNYLLAQEESKGPLSGLDDLQERITTHQALETALHHLETHLSELSRHIHRLPRLPDYGQVRWAQAVLAFPNLLFLEVDTTGLGHDASIVRVLLLDRDRQVRFDTHVQPLRSLSQQISQLTGIQQQDVQAAPTLAEAWPSIQAAFQGSYLLSYNLDFDQEHLQRDAERNHLQPPVLIADCLMQRWMVYRHEQQYPKLATLCQQIGQPLPDHPQQTAYHRACGQLALIEAMAIGIVGSTSHGSHTPAAETAVGDMEDDDHPF